MNGLIGLLFTICNVLLVPVIIVLLSFLGWTVILFGGFLREALARRGARRTLDQCLAAAKRGEAPARLWGMLKAARSGVAAAFCAHAEPGTAEPAILTHAVAELEHGITDSMARLSLLTRVGPMLGLMGTLIPLGPALDGLAAGDMQGMAQNLVVAFTTTVIGVFIGALSYAIGLVRRAWYARDLCDLEFICQRLAAKESAA
jgi:biopolymer transport protein ExbB/TolQ